MSAQIKKMKDCENAESFFSEISYHFAGEEMSLTKGFLYMIIFMLLFGSFSSVSAISSTTTTPGRFVSGLLSNSLSALLKWVWSLSSTTKTAISGRQIVKFESGYSVETVFDGAHLGIEPYAVEVLPSGDILILDSANSNIYKISQPVSRYSRPRLVAGSNEGYSGHVDGRPREARMNHPKSFAVDVRGNIYVADAMNMAIRKITDTEVTTIAGGMWNRVGKHVDGPSEDAKFSNDFEVVYIGSSCSLLVVDRENQAIREIQLQFDDCDFKYGTDFHLGLLVLSVAFFGYMLALLQRRVCAMISSNHEYRDPNQGYPLSSTCQKLQQSSVRSPLFPMDVQEKGPSTSRGNLFLNVGAFIFGGLFSIFRKKPRDTQYHNTFQQLRCRNALPVQESYLIPDEDEPPSLETMTPTPRKTYPFMSKDVEKTSHFWLGQAYLNAQDGEIQLEQHRHQRQYSLGPRTYYEQRCEAQSEVMFGAAQEDRRGEAVGLKPVGYGDPTYDHHNIRARNPHLGYNIDY